MKCCEKGRSMIEMLGVLAIVGVLSVGGIAGYSKAMTKYKRDQLIAQIAEIVINIRTIYFKQTSFSGISNHTLVSVGAIPNGMYDNSEKNNPNVKITHMMNGDVLIYPSYNGTELQQAFEIYITHLNFQTCLDLALTDWGQDPSSGFRAMYIGTDEITAAKMEAITSSADSNPSNGIYTPGQHEMAVPLTVGQATAACACSGSNCVIGLKYI